MKLYMATLKVIQSQSRPQSQADMGNDDASPYRSEKNIESNKNNSNKNYDGNNDNNLSTGNETGNATPNPLIIVTNNTTLPLRSNR